MAGGDFFCGNLGSRGNGDGIESRLAVSHQMTIAHDEAAAETADAPILAVRQFGMNL